MKFTFYLEERRKEAMLLNIAILVGLLLIVGAMFFKVEIERTGKKELVINGKKIFSLEKGERR